MFSCEIPRFYRQTSFAVVQFVTSPLVPVACVVIGLFCLALIIFTYKKELRKEEVNLETASFDFHPFQSTSSQSSNWSVKRIRQRISSWFSSDKDSSNNGNSFNFLNMPNYGTMSSEDEDAVA